MICIKELGELKVLFNVFYGLKYGIDNDELNRLVSSPYFSTIFNNTLLEMLNGYEELDLLNIIDRNQWNIDSRPTEMKKIRNYLSNIDSWDKLDEQIKNELVRILLSPFIHSDGSVVNLLKEINDSQKS